MSASSKPSKRSSMCVMLRADWQVPVTMLACLVGAVALAGAHHGFYLRMDQQLASDQGQAWVIRGGTALAYVVKVLLVIAASIAYVQMMWRSIRNKHTKMSQLDDMFSVLENALILSKYKSWYKNPLLYVLAVITWCLPLVAIIPPGAITVTSTPLPASGNTTLFYTRFDHLGWSQGLPFLNDNTTWRYAGSGHSIATLGALSIMTGSIMSAELPKINMTFSDTFYGPALSCDDADPKVSDALAQATLDLALAENVTLMYTSRVPKKLPNETSIRLTETGLLSNADANGQPSFIDMVSPDRASLYLSISAGFLGMTLNKSDVWTLRCGLYNASWHVDFDIGSNGSQSLKTRNLTFVNWVSGMSPIKNVTKDADLVKFGYGGVLDIFSSAAKGRLLGYPTPDMRAAKDGISRNTTSVQGLIIQSNRDLYTAIMEWGMQSTARQLNMSIERFGGDETYRENDVLRPIIISQLEETFKNMTLSGRYGYANTDMFGVINSRSYKYAEAVYPNGTIVTSSNVFTYSQQELILTYSVGIAVCLITTLIGAYAITERGKSYQTSFTTIARVTHKQPESDQTIKDSHDYSGAEPTARAIKDAHIYVGDSFLPPEKPKYPQSINSTNPPSPSSSLPPDPRIQLPMHNVQGVGKQQAHQRNYSVPHRI